MYYRKTYHYTINSSLSVALDPRKTERFFADVGKATKFNERYALGMYRGMCQVHCDQGYTGILCGIKIAKK